MASGIGRGRNEPDSTHAILITPVHSGPAYWIELSAQSDGTFTVTNARNGFSKTYRRDVQGTR